MQNAERAKDGGAVGLKDLFVTGNLILITIIARFVDWTVLYPNLKVTRLPMNERFFKTILLKKVESQTSKDPET